MERVHAVTAHFLDGTSERFDSQEDFDAAYPPVGKNAPKACCEACEETREMTREIHAAFKGLAGAMAGIAKNPMMTAMTRQFGFDPAVLANLGKTGE